jgi:parallel beta-helix repeat protein
VHSRREKVKYGKRQAAARPLSLHLRRRARDFTTAESQNLMKLTPLFSAGSKLSGSVPVLMILLLAASMLSAQTQGAAAAPSLEERLKQSETLIGAAGRHRSAVSMSGAAPALPAVAALGEKVGSPVALAAAPRSTQPEMAQTAAADHFIDNRSMACANVKDFGAKGDGQGDDTKAFVAALAARRAVCVPNGRYHVGTIDLPDSAVITGESRATEIFPLTAAQKGVFHASGTSFKKKVTHVQIRNLIIYNPFPNPPAGSYAVKFDYAEKSTLQNVILFGFYDNLVIFNSVFINLFAMESGYSTHTNVTANWTDASSGPYFGGWLYFDNFRSLGGLGAYSIEVQNYASVTMRELVAVGNKHVGVHVGQTVSAKDMTTTIVIDNCEFDSNGGAGLEFKSVRDSVVTNSWFSSGRDATAHGLLLQNCSTISVTNNKFFWNGSDGMRLEDTTYSSIAGNTSSSNKDSGIGLVNSTFNVIERNIVSSERYNDMGYVQARGIEEGGTSQRNVVIGNVVHGSRSSQIRASGQGTVNQYNVTQ